MKLTKAFSIIKAQSKCGLRLNDSIPHNLQNIIPEKYFLFNM